MKKYRDFLKKERERLEALSEERYRAFSKSLNPSPRPGLGIRMPALREEAKRLMKEGLTRTYLDAVLWALTATPKLVLEPEWTTLGSVLIGRDKDLSMEEHDQYFEAWLSQMDGWGVCDAHASEAHFVRERREGWQKKLLTWLVELNATLPSSVWKARVALVVILAHYKDRQYLGWACLMLEHPSIERALKAYEAANALAKPAKVNGTGGNFESGEGYYLSMVVAWCWTVFYVLDPEHVRARVVALTKENRLDEQTALRVVSKVRDSLAISDEEKALLRQEVKDTLKAIAAEELDKK